MFISLSYCPTRWNVFARNLSS
ncbi:MAG: hypothetical protein WDW38_003431 [Sanguina aurantia]